MYSNMETTEYIHIVMCSYKRVCNIPDILKSLSKQSVSYRIHLHILNNNSLETENLNNIINDTTYTIRITLKHYNNENNIFERFIYSKELRQMGVSYIIYIDDDMSYKSTWVEQMYNMRKPTHFITWYVKLFTHNNDCIDYHNTTNNYILLNYSCDSIITYNDSIKNKNNDYIYGNYGGPGGSIIDATIFDNDDFYKLPNEDLKFMDDIWISCYIIREIKWKIKRSFLPPTLILNKTTTNTALYDKIAPMKNKWFLILVNNQ